MSFGFPAYAEKSARYRGISRIDLLRAAEDALHELGWNPQPDGKWRVRASVPTELHAIFLTWGARFFVEIDEEELFLRSEGSFALAWMDFGQHDHNIRRFLDRFEEILDEEE